MVSFYGCKGNNFGAIRIITNRDNAMVTEEIKVAFVYDLYISLRQVGTRPYTHVSSFWVQPAISLDSPECIVYVSRIHIPGYFKIVDQTYPCLWIVLDKTRSCRIYDNVPFGSLADMKFCSCSQCLI